MRLFEATTTIFLLALVAGCSTTDSGTSSSGSTSSGSSSGSTSSGSSSGSTSSGSSSGSTSSGSSSGSTSSGGVADGGGDSGGSTAGCNSIANVGTVVGETANAAALPTMTGGPIADGTYVLSTNVQYAGTTAGSTTHKRTLLIAGKTIQIVNSDDGKPDVHASITIDPTGIELNEKGTCPATLNPTPGTYTATPTTLAIQKHGTSQLESYTKQ